MLYTDRGRVRHWEEQVRKDEGDDGPGCGIAFVKTMQELSGVYANPTVVAACRLSVHGSWYVFPRFFFGCPTVSHHRLLVHTDNVSLVAVASMSVSPMCRPKLSCGCPDFLFALGVTQERKTRTPWRLYSLARSIDCVCQFGEAPKL